MARGIMGAMGLRPLDLSYPLDLSSGRFWRTAHTTALPDRNVRELLASSSWPALPGLLSPTAYFCSPLAALTSDRDRRCGAYVVVYPGVVYTGIGYGIGYTASVPGVEYPRLQ